MKIIFTITILIAIAVIALLVLRRARRRRTLEDLFDNTTKNVSDVGGLLVNNFGVQWFEKMLASGTVNFTDTSVCASENRGTCTAYSYIRRDLIPMFFTYPGISSYVPCGIILDPKKIWPLITLMAVVDADTNNRSCCTNDSYGPILTRNPFGIAASDRCIETALISKYGKDSPFMKYAVFIPLKNEGGGCPTSCNGDKNCTYNNSGGNINQWLMNASPECAAGNFNTCFDFEEISIENVPTEIHNIFGDAQPAGYLIQKVAKDCATCSKPYLCVASGTEAKTVHEDERIASYIGKDGEGFLSLFNKNFNMGNFAISQCRFEKKDWNLFVKVLKEWYKTLLAVMKPDNSMSPELSFLLANPQSQAYFENEVNLYINPDASTDEAKRQNQIFQDAIVGFYYTGKTCEEQVAPLDSVDTHIEGGQKYTNAADRCDGFWRTDDATMDRGARLHWESSNMDYARKLVHNVAKMFNDKNGRAVPVYKSLADNNSFPNFKSLSNALKGKVNINDYLIVDSRPE